MDTFNQLNGACQYHRWGGEKMDQKVSPSRRKVGWDNQKW